MGDGPQAGEEAAVPHLLEVALAHVLPARTARRGNSRTQHKESSLQTSAKRSFQDYLLIRYSESYSKDYNYEHSTFNGLNVQHSQLLGNNNNLEKTSDSTRIIICVCVCVCIVFFHIYIHTVYIYM